MAAYCCKSFFSIAASLNYCVSLFYFLFVLHQVCRRAYPAYWSGHWNTRFQLCYKWTQEGVSHSEFCCTGITSHNLCIIPRKTIKCGFPFVFFSSLTCNKSVSLINIQIKCASCLFFFFPQGNATLHLYPHFKPLQEFKGMNILYLVSKFFLACLLVLEGLAFIHYMSLINFQEFQSTWALRSVRRGRRGSAWWHLWIHQGWWMVIWSTPLMLMRSSCGSVSYLHLTFSAVTVRFMPPIH